MAWRAVVMFPVCARGHEGPPQAAPRAVRLPACGGAVAPGYGLEVCPACGSPRCWVFEFMAEYYSRRSGKVPASGS